MKTKILLFLLLLPIGTLLAQRTTFNGIVTDEQSGNHVAQAVITVPGSTIAVVTNDDGVFSLKVEEVPTSIIVSHIGYQTRQMAISPEITYLHIQLTPATQTLNEVMVRSINALELVRSVVDNIPKNYSKVPELHKCFYRETAMKRQHFIYVAEGVVDMYKSDYNHDILQDRVAIIKGRRLVSTKANDTLGVKVMGGPLIPLQLDVVKNNEILFDKEELLYYHFSMEDPVVIRDRSQYVVSLRPVVERPYPLYYGRLYIDQQTLALTRAEISLDVSDRRKATNFMLVRKPAGVRFRPRELSYLIDYRLEDGVMRLSYLRTTFRFNCDWKRRLFATSYTVSCEMVVTDRTSENVKRIRGRDSFDTSDAFYDKVEYFRDPDFWEDYNIIEPTETLDRAVGRLLKQRVP